MQRAIFPLPTIIPLVSARASVPDLQGQDCIPGSANY